MTADHAAGSNKDSCRIIPPFVNAEHPDPSKHHGEKVNPSSGSSSHREAHSADEERWRCSSPGVGGAEGKKKIGARPQLCHSDRVFWHRTDAPTGNSPPPVICREPAPNFWRHDLRCAPRVACFLLSARTGLSDGIVAFIYDDDVPCRITNSRNSKTSYKFFLPTASCPH